MTDQPNRPAFRMTETSFPEIEALTKSMFLDGLVQGLPIAKNVKLVIEQSVTFGRDEAMRSDSLPWSARFDCFDDLVGEATTTMIDGMFSGGGIAKTLYSVMMLGIAYGFHSEKHKMNYAAVESALAKVFAEHVAGKVSDETADEFFGELMKINSDEVAIEYARKAMAEHRVRLSTKVPNYVAFTKRYMSILEDLVA